MLNDMNHHCVMQTNVAIKFSVHDLFLEYPSSGKLIYVQMKTYECTTLKALGS